MNGPVVGGILAIAAVAGGAALYGWQGAVLGVTIVAFWLLLQFSRAVRVLRLASQAPVGRVPNAVMLHAGLRRGMRLVDVILRTRSLGEPIAQTPETWAWRDAADDVVTVELEAGRVVRWRLDRAGGAAVPPAGGEDASA